MLFTKRRIETFWFRNFSNTRNIRTYCFKYFEVYILIHLHQNQKRKNLNYSQRLLKYIKCHKYFNTIKLYTSKSLLSQNQFYFFLLISCHAPAPLSIGMPRY